MESKCKKKQQKSQAKFEQEQKSGTEQGQVEGWSRWSRKEKPINVININKKEEQLHQKK